MKMSPILFVGVWTLSIALVAVYGGFFYRTRPAPAQAEAYASHAKARDLKTITVPMIRDGQVRGYISADFSIVGEISDPHQQNSEVDSYVLDEAYRLIYAETSIDFDALRKTDLSRLTVDIKSRVNARLSREALQDVLVRSFHFIPRDQLQK